MNWFSSMGLLAKIAVALVVVSVLVAVFNFIVGDKEIAVLSLLLGGIVLGSLLTNRPSDPGATGDDGWNFGDD